MEHIVSATLLGGSSCLRYPIPHSYFTSTVTSEEYAVRPYLNCSYLFFCQYLASLCKSEEMGQTMNNEFPSIRHQRYKKQCHSENRVVEKTGTDTLLG